MDRPVEGVTCWRTFRRGLSGFCSHRGQECSLEDIQRTSLRRGQLSCCDGVGRSAVTRADHVALSSSHTPTCRCTTTLTECGSASDRSLPVDCRAEQGTADDEEYVKIVALCGRCDCLLETGNEVRADHGT